MPNLALTKDELTLVTEALDQSIASAKRQQNMKGKTPMITEVYEKHQRILQTLRDKITDAK